jgi:hypothetical protein
MILKTKHTLRSSLMKTRSDREPQQMAHCVCSIPYECCRSYIGETGRPLTMWLRERRHNIRGHVENSKLAQHAYKGHRVGWDEARILAIESNSWYKKCKESAHMACLDISPIWIPLISNDVSSSQGRSTWSDRFFMGICMILVPGFNPPPPTGH